jgi:hypothetical protein
MKFITRFALWTEINLIYHCLNNFCEKSYQLETLLKTKLYFYQLSRLHFDL